MIVSAGEADIAVSGAVGKRHDVIYGACLALDGEAYVVLVSDGLDVIFAADVSCGRCLAGDFRLDESCLTLPVIAVEAEVYIVGEEEFLGQSALLVYTSVECVEEHDLRFAVFRVVILERLYADADVHLARGHYQNAFCVDAVAGEEIELVVAAEFLDVFFLAHVVFLVLVDHVDHLRREERVELRAHLLDDDLSYGRLRERIPVASLGCHSIVSVSHSDDPGELGNIVALELVRVASSVESLVVMVGADAEVGELYDTGEDVLADRGVFLDLLVFFVCQLALLVDDLVGYSDLADIVQECREVDLVALFLVLADHACDHFRVARDSRGVTVCVLVLGIDSARECFRGLFEESLRALLLGRQVFDPEVVGVRIGLVHVLKCEQVEQERHGGDG